MFIIIYKGKNIHKINIDICVYTAEYTYMYFLVLSSENVYRKLQYSSNEHTMYLDLVF